MTLRAVDGLNADECQMRKTPGSGLACQMRKTPGSELPGLYRCSDGDQLSEKVT